MADIKEESEDVKIEETFRVKQEETEEQTGLFLHQPPKNQQKMSPKTKNSEMVLAPLLDQPHTSAAEKVKETEAPTLETTLQEARQTIEVQLREIANLKEWVDVLKEERNFLRERLKEALAVKSDMGGDVAKNVPPIGQAPGKRKPKSEITESSSSDSSSESDSDSEFSDAKEAKKPKKAKKTKKMGKKLRVKTPDDSIRRYNLVLEKVKKERISKAEAYSRLGVDRNTIVCQAPIAELAATHPDLFSTLRSRFKRRDSLKRFAETCRGFCEQEPTASAILKKKDNGSLLDIFKN